MAQDFDVQDARRRMVKDRDGRKIYYNITEEDIMYSASNEASIDNADRHAYQNAICRLISKLRKRGGTWEEVLAQLDAANGPGWKTDVQGIAQVIRDDTGLPWPVKGEI